MEKRIVAGHWGADGNLRCVKYGGPSWATVNLGRGHEDKREVATIGPTGVIFLDSGIMFARNPPNTSYLVRVDFTDATRRGLRPIPASSQAGRGTHPAIFQFSPHNL